MQQGRFKTPVYYHKTTSLYLTRAACFDCREIQVAGEAAGDDRDACWIIKENPTYLQVGNLEDRREGAAGHSALIIFIDAPTRCLCLRYASLVT